MKLAIVILCILCIAGAIGTTLYFTSPMVVIDEVGIPHTISVASEPEPPDTIYLADSTISDSLTNIIMKLRSELSYMCMQIDTMDTNKQMIYISTKQFTMSDLLANVTSDVTMYGARPVDLVENSITIVPNQEELARRIGVATGNAHKKGMKTGLLIGAGAAAAIIVATMVIGK